MEDILKQKRDKLYKILSDLGEDIAITMVSDLHWFEIRGYTYEEAQREVLNKYRQIILNNDDITSHIVGYKDAYIDFAEPRATIRYCLLTRRFLIRFFS